LNLNELHEAYLKDPLLVDEFASELTSFITRTVKSECKRHSASTYDSIEDAIGESLLDVWEALGTFDSARSQFTTWVTTIVLRNIADIYRKYNKRQELSIDPDYSITHHEKGPTTKLSLDKLISELNDEDKSFVLMKMRGLSELELDTFFTRKQGWANDKWRYLKVKLHALNYGF